jgi:hypothetical protein
MLLEIQLGNTPALPNCLLGLHVPMTICGVHL